MDGRCSCWHCCAGPRFRHLAYHGAAVRDCADLHPGGLLVGSRPQAAQCLHNHQHRHLFNGHASGHDACDHFVEYDCPMTPDWSTGLITRSTTSLSAYLQLALLFCSYFYVKSYAEGSGVIHLAAGIV